MDCDQHREAATDVLTSDTMSHSLVTRVLMLVPRS